MAAETAIVPGIVANPEVAFGKPVIASTRLPVTAVLSQLAEGVPEAEIRAEYDLSPEQVHAALRYAAWLAERDAAERQRPAARLQGSFVEHGCDMGERAWTREQLYERKGGHRHRGSGEGSGE